ncbi:MAG: hypothetical protein R3E88_00385 [Myxococcota bacterium]|nr:hypothetical protein [Myxococcales bacterium]
MRSRAGRVLSRAFLALLACAALAPAASAGTTVLSFLYPDASDIAEFRALIGFGSGNYEHEVSLGVPTPNGPVFSAQIAIPDDKDVYVAIVAVSRGGLRSAPSNERIRRTTADVLGAPGEPIVELY